jgi:hypothetical protein
MELKPIPLIVGLKLYNQNPNLWSVPRKGTHGHSKLMNLIPSKKKKPESKEVAEEIYKLGRSLGYKFE